MPGLDYAWMMNGNGCVTSAVSRAPGGLAKEVAASLKAVDVAPRLILRIADEQTTHSGETAS